jgi:hypothetical protein
VGKGSVVFADGKLYAQSERGVMGLVDPTPTGYREISRFEFPAGRWETWTPPTISDAKLYIRDQDNLFSFDIKAK